MAQYKADVLNKFVADNEIETVIEWGCGEGNQLSLAKYPHYIGCDISQTAVDICNKKFAQDVTKQFVWCGAEEFENTMKAELALSLDVIYHLVEDDVYENYLQRLFDSGIKYVAIYSCNFEKEHAEHVRCRRFTDYIEKHVVGWELAQIMKNPYPYDENDPDNASWSDFYFYKK